MSKMSYSYECKWQHEYWPKTTFLFVRPVHELRNQHSALGCFGRVVSAHFWVGRFGLRRWVVLVNFCEELFRPLAEVNEKNKVVYCRHAYADNKFGV